MSANLIELLPSLAMVVIAAAGLVLDYRVRIRNVSERHTEEVKTLSEKHTEDVRALSEKHTEEIASLETRYKTERDNLADRLREAVDEVLRGLSSKGR